MFMILAVSIIIMGYAIYKIVKYEEGLQQILWILMVIFIPPFAVVYLGKTAFE